MENNQDMLKMFEQVKALSQIISMSNGKKQESNKNDLDKTKKAMEMAKLFSLLNDTNSLKSKDETKEENKGKEKYFDDDIMSMELKTIKSAIPYLDYKYQKPMGMFIKFVEIQKLMDMYSEKVMSTGETKNPNWKKEMLLAIRVHMDDEKKNKIDMILKVLDMNEIIIDMKEMRV